MQIELETCELFYSLHRLILQSGLFCKCKGEKKNKKEKNVLALSALGFSIGQWVVFFFFFWMKSGILMGTHSQLSQPLKALLVRQHPR